MSTRENDAVCLFEGSCSPIIIRPHRDYWTVVSVGVSVNTAYGALKKRYFTVDEFCEFLSGLGSPSCDDSVRELFCDLSLVWDWRPQAGDESEWDGLGQSSYKDLVASRLPEYARDEALAMLSDDTIQLMNMALGLAAARLNLAACTIFQEVAMSLVIDPGPDTKRLSFVLGTADDLISWCDEKYSPSLCAATDIIGRRGTFCDSREDALITTFSRSN